MFDISVIVNAHREGLAARPTLRSLDHAIQTADAFGIRVEIIFVLDRSDYDTVKLFSNWSSQKKSSWICPVDFADLGLSRNYGVSIARGKWIAFLDADDLWGRDWLMRAFKTAESDHRDIIWHPELNLYFGVQKYVFVHFDMEESRFDIAHLAHTNLWTALCFTRRSILLEIPYKRTDYMKQYGYEDWSWNMDTISKNIIHKIVPDTIHSIRTKSDSLVTQTSSHLCLPHPTDLFLSIVKKGSANI